MILNKIDPKKCAVLVIDMQGDFLWPDAPLYSKMGEDMIPKMSRYLDSCRELGMKIIYTRTAYRPDGADMGSGAKFCEPAAKGIALRDGLASSEVVPELTPKEGDILIDKYKYSAFYGTNLDILLTNLGIETVAITGVCTEACCFSTARDAGFRELGVAFISDMTGTIDFPDLGYGAMKADDMHRAMLINIALTTAHVMSSEEMLALSK